MNYNCTVCGKSVTPASYQYCIKNEYPVICHQHQQELGYNRYHVLTEVEIEVAKEQAAKEKLEYEAREQQRKNNIIPMIEASINKIINKREYMYTKVLLQDLEEARKQNVITPEKYNEYIAIYYTYKDKKDLTGKQKADIWNKEVNNKIKELTTEIISSRELESVTFMTKDEVFNELDQVINEYNYVEEDKEEFLNSFMSHLQEITESYYYEDGNEIKFGYKM